MAAAEQTPGESVVAVKGEFNSQVKDWHEAEGCRWTPPFDGRNFPDTIIEVQVGPSGKAILPTTVV